MSIEVGHSVRYNMVFGYGSTAVGRVLFKRGDEVLVLFEAEDTEPWLDLAREIELEIV